MSANLKTITWMGDKLSDGTPIGKAFDPPVSMWEAMREIRKLRDELEAKPRA